MNILFICTGNTCRSPMAAGIFEKILDEKNLTGLNVSSAGISADNTSRATQNAIKVCEAINVDLRNHVSRSIFDVNLNAVDKFVVMTQMHRSFLLNLGVKSEKIFVLGGQISDPFGGNLEVYAQCRDQIYSALREFIENLNLGDDNAGHKAEF